MTMIVLGILGLRRKPATLANAAIDRFGGSVPMIEEPVRRPVGQ
jgi:hypothetical protein